MTLIEINPHEVILPVDFVPDSERLDVLTAGIKENGMLHTPIIREDKTIVAGKYRVYVAAHKLHLPMIRVCVVPQETSELDCENISLDENLSRFNLPWYEQVVLEKRKHDLRQQQHGAGRRGKKTGWSLRDTAEELGVALGPLSEDIRLAEALLANPALAKVKDKQTAKRIIFTDTKRILQEFRSSTISDTIPSDVVLFGSAEEILKLFPDNHFDACITDPPWLKFQKDSSLIKDEFTLSVFEQVYRVMRNNSFLYMVVSTPDFFVYHEQLPEFGFTVQDYPLIWVKGGVLSRGTKSWEYQRNYEPILIAVKGTPALTGDMYSAIIQTAIVPPAKMVHPNEKPMELIRQLISDCTYDSATVLDPFAGSGVLGSACRDINRHFVLIERQQRFYAQICERIGQHDS